MSVEEWKNIFISAGSFIVGLILACGQLYTVIKMKKQETRQEKKDMRHSNLGKDIQAENKYALEIQKEIEELRQAMNADRVQVLEFHNGTDFSTRKGYKLDCTYETIKYGNEPTKGLVQNYPTTMLPIFMSKLIQDKQYMVSDIENIHENDMSTYVMKLNMHVGSFFDVALEHNGDTIGILAVQYAEPRTIDTDQLAIIHAKKIIIEELLK